MYGVAVLGGLFFSVIEKGIHFLCMSCSLKSDILVLVCAASAIQPLLEGEMGTPCHVSYSKTIQTSGTLLYALGYFPEISPPGYRLGISCRLIVRLLVPIVLDNTPGGT